MKRYAITLLTILIVAATATARDVVKWTFELAPGKPGEVELRATAKVDAGWHLYDTEIPDGGPYATMLSLDELAGAVQKGKFASVGSKPYRVFDPVFNMEVGYYDGEATFRQVFAVTDPEAFLLKGDVRAQACSDEQCTPPLPVDFSFTAADLPPAVKAPAVKAPVVKAPTVEAPAGARADLAAPAAGAAAAGQGAGAGNAPGGGNAAAAAGQASGVGEAAGDADDNTAGAVAAAGQSSTPTPTAGAGEAVAAAGHAPTPTSATGEAAAGVPESDLWRPVVDELHAYGAAGTTRDRSPLWIFILGLGGGLLALLTPCVWPMIPMTVSFFIKQNKTRNAAIKEAAVYGLSIVVIYVVLGLLITITFGSNALNNLSTSAIFNLLFFALLVVFAASFLGAFEITLPSKWTNRANRKAEQTTGLLSIFFMAFTLALVSFSCTGPIIGTLLVDAAASGQLLAPAVGMLGFAIALAIPFALFAIFPSWLSGMPRSGGWLNSVKVVLGLLELAFALKFLSVADLSYGWRILDREVFLVLWIVIFALIGIYLLGKIRFRHDGDLPYVSVPRLFLATLSLSFALYMVPGLWGAPLKAISAFAPPVTTQDFNLYDGVVHAKFDDYEAGMEYARRNGKPVIVDFSGLGCVNCRKMEASVWSEPRVKSILDNDYVLITLMVDERTRLAQTIEVEENGRTVRLKTVGDRWSYLQRHKFGTSSQPYYVLLDPFGKPIGPSYAYDEDVEKYLKFLNSGLTNFRNK